MGDTSRLVRNSPFERVGDSFSLVNALFKRGAKAVLVSSSFARISVRRSGEMETADVDSLNGLLSWFYVAEGFGIKLGTEPF